MRLISTKTDITDWDLDEGVSSYSGAFVLLLTGLNTFEGASSTVYGKLEISYVFEYVPLDTLY